MTVQIVDNRGQFHMHQNAKVELMNEVLCLRFENDILINYILKNLIAYTVIPDDRVVEKRLS